MFQPIYTKIIKKIQKSLGVGSDWIIDSVIDHTISISKYNSLAGSSYIKLPKELDHPRKGLINIQSNHNNESCKWCLVVQLNPADHNARREEPQKLIRNLQKDLILKRENFQSKLEKFIKLKKRVPLALAFLFMKIRKNIQSMNQKNVTKKNMLTYYWLEKEKKALCS